MYLSEVVRLHAKMNKEGDGWVDDRWGIAARGGAAGLILSAKTTLRERWKQVQREMGSRDLFLATVDETIAGNAIQDMADMGITLVVPEALKDRTSTAARAAEYRGHRNVLSFRAFFDDVLKGQRLPGWPRAV